MPERQTDRRSAREPGQPDVNPARLATDPLLAEIAELVAYMDLHIGRHEYKRLTSRQKELWADLVDAAAVRQSFEDDEPSPRRTVRWWRDYRRPIGEEGHAHGEQVACRGCGRMVTWDADMETFWIPYSGGNPTPETFNCVRGPLGEPHWSMPSGAAEPDPFLYDDERNGRATAEADDQRDVEPRARGDRRPAHEWGDAGAARVARFALLDVLTDPMHPERAHLGIDFAAVYEWAKAHVRPMQVMVGSRTGEIGDLRTYPSAVDAQEFLTVRRSARGA